MKTHLFLAGIIVCLNVCFSAHGTWSPFWEVRFTDSLDTGSVVYTDTYAVGPGDADGYDMSEDVLKVYDPGWPDEGGYAGPWRPYVAMTSTVAGEIKLSRDARPEPMTTKNWDIDKEIGGTLTGTETISWSLTNISSAMTVKLIDYGTDASRNIPLAVIDLKDTSTPSYNFAITSASGTYRYMRFQAVTIIDTDSDGMDDKWEIAKWGNLSHTAEGDDDVGGGDGYSNYEEYISNTDPTDSSSYFEIYLIEKDNTDSVTLYWSGSSTERLYSMSYNDTGLGGDNWAMVPGLESFRGIDGNDLWTDNGANIVSPIVSSILKRFYRLMVDIPDAAQGKKLLAWAVNAVEPAYLKQHIRELEEMYPAFDGVIVPAYPDDWTGSRNGQQDHWFGSVVLDTGDFDDVIADLQATNFEKFTDNFLYLTTSVRAVGENISWFDAGWSQIAENGAVMAYICKQAGFKGFMLDMETYGALGEFSPPFEYDPYVTYGLTLEEVKAKVRQRANEFMDAVTAVYPDITIILIQDAYQSTGSGGAYELQSSFTDGLLERVGQATLISGGEGGYTRQEYQQFLDLKEEIRLRSLALTTLPELYLAEVTQAFGFCGPDGFATWYTENSDDFDSNFRSPNGLEHSLYGALTASDKYVWIFPWHPSVYWHPDLTLQGQQQSQCSLCPHSQMPQEYLDAFANSRRFHDLNWTSPWSSGGNAVVERLRCSFNGSFNANYVDAGVNGVSTAHGSNATLTEGGVSITDASANGTVGGVEYDVSAANYDWVALPDWSNYDDYELTVEFWWKRTSSASACLFGIGNWNSNDSAYIYHELTIDNTGIGWFSGYPSAPSPPWGYAAYTFNVGQWYHIAWASDPKDPLGDDGNAKIYVNGQLVHVSASPPSRSVYMYPGQPSKNDYWHSTNSRIQLGGRWDSGGAVGGNVTSSGGYGPGSGLGIYDDFVITTGVKYNVNFTPPARTE